MVDFEDDSAWTRVLRTVLPPVIVVVALYAAAQLLSRTEGVRTIVAEKFEESLGVPVSIGRLRTDWMLDLVFNDVRIGASNDLHGIVLGRAVLDWSAVERVAGRGSWLREIRLADSRVTLAMNQRGSWEPRALAPMTDWMEKWGRIKVAAAPPRAAEPGEARAQSPNEKPAEAAKPAPSSGWTNLHIRIANGEIRWRDRTGQEVAWARGIDFESAPVVLPQRTLHYYRMHVADSSAASGSGQPGMNAEFLVLSPGHYVLLGGQAAVQAAWTAIKDDLTAPRTEKSRPAPVPQPPPARKVEPKPARVTRPVPAPTRPPVVEEVDVYIPDEEPPVRSAPPAEEKIPLPPETVAIEVEEESRDAREAEELVDYFMKMLGEALDEPAKKK